MLCDACSTVMYLLSLLSWTFKKKIQIDRDRKKINKNNDLIRGKKERKKKKKFKKKGSKTGKKRKIK